MPIVPSTQATGILHISAIPEDGDNFSIGGRQYVFRDEADAADEVQIGGSTGDTADNIAGAINVGDDSSPNAQVTAEVFEGAEEGFDIVLTAIDLGESGNNIHLVENSTVLEFLSEYTEGGVTGYSYFLFAGVGRHVPDGDPDVVLRMASDELIDEDEAGLAVPLRTLGNAYWDRVNVPQQTFSALVNVLDLSYADPDSQYTLEFQVAVTEEDYSAPEFEVITRIPLKDKGAFIVNFDGPTIDKILANSNFIRTYLTADSGDAGWNYEAWLLPAINQG